MSSKDAEPIRITVKPIGGGLTGPKRAKSQQAALEGVLQPYLNRLKESAQRAVSLVELSLKVQSAGGRPFEVEDLLRAAVVLSHAHLDDLLRTLAIELLPEGSEDSMKDIKVSLGTLVRHKGKLVDEALPAVVSETLRRQSFNTTKDVREMMKKLGVNLPGDKEEEKDLVAIDQMMKRRHQIVHGADRVKLPDSDTYTLCPIEASEVQNWVLATRRFMIRLVARSLTTEIRLRAMLNKEPNSGSVRG